MLTFEIILGLLFGAALLALAAERLKIPYPVFLALMGMAIAASPGIPVIQLSGELILALLVAPVLLDAAHDISLRDLRDNKLPVISLVFIAVILTTLTVAWTVKFFLPEIPWAGAIALGALLAPTDAVAAIAVMRQVNPPERIKVVLEGESLFNDASSLLIYGLAIQTLSEGAFPLTGAVGAFLRVGIGSIVMGWLLAKGVGYMLRYVRDPAIATVLQFVTTFGIWIFAEYVGFSGVITVVCFGLTAARAPSSAIPTRVRVNSFATWETVTFILNIIAFVLIGLQLRSILPVMNWHWFVIACLCLLVIVVVRILWVLCYHFLFSERGYLRNVRDSSVRIENLKQGIVVSWSGMRGIVTLAAALALPEEVPFRQFMILVAFVVVLGTLLIQGLTLHPLLRLLRLKKDTHTEKETNHARSQVYAALSAVLQPVRPPDISLPIDDVVKEACILFIRADQSARHESLIQARSVLYTLRKKGDIGDGVYRKTENELDGLELIYHDQ